VLSALLVPESRAPRPRRLDPVGQVLVFTLLASLTYAIIEGPAAGWRAPEIVGLFVVAGAALAALLRYERHHPEPLLDIRFFGSMPFSGATLTAVCGFAALAGFQFLTALYLQDVRGFTPLRAGLYTLPMAAMTAVFAPVSGRLVASRGARLPLVVAGGSLTAGAAMLSGASAGTSMALLVTGYLIFGLGFGMLNAPITNTAVSGMPVAQAGLAAAIASTSRQVGQSLGVAVVGSAVASGLAGTGLVAASRLGWWIVTGCGALVLALGILSTTRWARGTALAVRERIAMEAETMEVGTR
jgi:hypothetical protein